MLPRFSLRMALLALTAGSMVSIILAAASGGHKGAIGATIAMGAALLMLVVHALVYALAYGFGLLTRASEPHATSSVAAPVTTPSPANSNAPQEAAGAGEGGAK